MSIGQDIIGEGQDKLAELVDGRCPFDAVGEKCKRRSQEECKRRRDHWRHDADPPADGDGLPARHPEPFQFIACDQHVEEQQPHQVTEEQGNSPDIGDNRHDFRVSITPGNPGSAEQQRHPYPGDKVEKAQQKRRIIGDQGRRKRPRRPGTEVGATISDDAGDGEQQT